MIIIVTQNKRTILNFENVIDVTLEEAKTIEKVHIDWCGCCNVLYAWRLFHSVKESRFTDYINNWWCRCSKWLGYFKRV